MRREMELEVLSVQPPGEFLERLPCIPPQPYPKRRVDAAIFVQHCVLKIAV
jgi:hypothetical protein